MPQDDFKPRLGRMRDAGRTRLLKHTTRVFQQAGKAGVRALRQKGHVSPSALKRGMGAGVRAAAGLIAPGSRRVIVKARYTRIVGGDLGAARAHLKYILRDGVTRNGLPGQLYDASHDEADGSAFLARSGQDPHQFRLIVSAEDSARLADLKPFIRDLLSQMERDLETRLDWVAVDHCNTGHPHTHIVIRGRDDQGRDLVMARDYIAHGVRARAQGLITFELGPETDLERTQKLFNETGQERLTRLDRALLARAKDGILVITTAEEHDPVQQTLRIGRLRTLERLGLAQERQQGVWELDGKLESKLRRLGDRADKFRAMQQVLKELGIDRGAAAMALFERGPRKVPLIGQVIGVGMVDEITDRTWVVVDAVNGRVHYADLGRLKPDDIPHRGMLVALAGHCMLLGLAMFSHHSVPSRGRGGFGGLLQYGEVRGTLGLRILEGGRRPLGAARCSVRREVFIRNLSIGHDVHDVPRDRFLTASDACRRCRSGALDLRDDLWCERIDLYG